MGSLIVTTSWDDGSALDLRLASLLQKYGLKGTFYIPRVYLDGSLSERDIIALDREFEVGAHTLSHAGLTKLPLAEAEKEISGSKAYLEDLLGHAIPMFCYPMGWYNRDVKEAVRSAGFVAARTCDFKGFGHPEDPYEWGITLYSSNGSPLKTVLTWLKAGVSIRSVADWGVRAKLLFDATLEAGGIFHIWGHSWEFEEHDEWTKLDGVLEYISSRKGVSYLTNGAIFEEGGSAPR